MLGLLTSAAGARQCSGPLPSSLWNKTVLATCSRSFSVCLVVGWTHSGLWGVGLHDMSWDLTGQTPSQRKILSGRALSGCGNSHSAQQKLRQVCFSGPETACHYCDESISLWAFWLGVAVWPWTWHVAPQRAQHKPGLESSLSRFWAGIVHPFLSLACTLH